MTFSALLALLLAVFTAGSAQAGSPHLVTGYEYPSCSTTGTTVSCTGTQIAGVGNQDATVNLTVSASATLLCHNPGNDNVVEPHTVTFSASSGDVVVEPKNGRLVIPALSVTATLSPTPTCPNPNWRAEVTDVTVTGFSYTIHIGDTLFFSLP